MSAWPTHRNLLRDGAEDVAWHVRRVTTACRGQHVLCVRSTGKVRVVPLCKLKPEDEAEMIGTYTRKTPVGTIEADCLEFLKGLTV